ncbi:MAG: VanZ family protein [Mangrovibacterium sp.]
MMLTKIIRIASKHLTLIKAFTFVWFLVITFLCIVPQDELPEAGGIPYFDKFVHFTLYFIFSILSLFVFSSGKMSTKILILAGIFVFSFLIEVTQGIMPYGRTFSVTDLLANLSGILAGLLLFQKKIKYLPSQQ